MKKKWRLFLIRCGVAPLLAWGAAGCRNVDYVMGGAMMRVASSLDDVLIGETARRWKAITVIDDAALPVKDARVSVWFTKSDKPREVFFQGGTTDACGEVAFMEEAASMADFNRREYRIIKIGVEKPGYYATRHEDPGRDAPLPADHLFGFRDTRVRGSIKSPVLLKPIKNPAPLPVRESMVSPIPAPGASLAFDLVAGDWMPPHGNGLRADITLRTEGSRLALCFVEEGAGYYPWMGEHWSAFPLPYEAREDFYARREFAMPFDFPARSFLSPENARYLIFRVRAGAALHGAMALPNVLPGDAVQLTYVLNPTGGRNLEGVANALP